MIYRILNLPEHNSFFLFGARGVGKTSLIRNVLGQKKCLWIDLLNEETLETYLLHPQRLFEEISALQSGHRPEWVVIDEVQKVPKLLNIVHQSLESNQGVKFALTGSSARRLKQRGVNLLAGRAWVKNLFPFTFLEQPDETVESQLRWGSLPKLSQLVTEPDRADYLRSYTLTYIRTEVQEEQWVRKLEPFRKFLPIAAQMNGLPLNFTEIARGVGVDTTTVQNYFDILEETLLGFRVEAYHRSIRKQQRMAPKFYFFDLGVKRALERRLNVELTPGTSEYGYAFEHLVVAEIFRLNEYFSRDYELFYLQTKDAVEIDLVIDRPGKPTALVEIKSRAEVKEKDLRHLKRVAVDLSPSESYVLSQDPTPKEVDKVLCLPWQTGIRRILDVE